MNFSQRFARQLVMPEVGPPGQEKLRQSRVLVIGCGGLGSAATYYLAAAGVGLLGLVDADTVEESNLNRQILHGSHRLAWPKVESAALTLQTFFPELKVTAYQLMATAENLPGLIADRDYDYVIDASDNFSTKFMINDICVQLGRPFSHAGVLAWEGQTMTWLPGYQAPCLRCLFSAAPCGENVPTSRDVGIIGAVAGTLGAIQATEAIKYLLGRPDLLLGKLFIYNGLGPDARSVSFQIRPGCPCEKEGGEKDD